MNVRNRSLFVAMVAGFLVGGVALAAGTTQLDSLRVGTPGSGGVTFFNGSVVNESGPMTIADDWRVDGRITRLDGQEGKPVIVGDSLEVEGDLHAENIYTKTQTYGKDDVYTRSQLYTRSQADNRYVLASNPEWDAKTQILSVHASAFVSDDDSADYAINEQGLFLETEGETHFYAPVNLPHGANITRMEAIVTDGADEDLSLTLKSQDTEGQIKSHASIVTSGVTAGAQTVADTSIAASTVNTETHTYFLDLELNKDVQSKQNLGFVKILYTVTGI